MAKNGTNVSQAIREFAKNHRSMGPTETAAEVSKKVGKKIPPSYVSNVKNLMGGKKRKAKRRVMAKRGKRGSVRRVASGFDISHIKSVKSLVAEIGADTVKQLADVV